MKQMLSFRAPKTEVDKLKKFSGKNRGIRTEILVRALQRELVRLGSKRAR